jgi:hypothetical protein
MGLNIFVRTAENDSDEWNSNQHDGDSEFYWDHLSEVDCDHLEDDRFSNDSGNAKRPKDISALRDQVRLSSLPNKERFNLLLDILEKHPDFWVDMTN